MSPSIEVIKEMREQGMTFQQIADKYGVSKQRIHQKLNGKYKQRGTRVLGNGLKERRVACGLKLKEASRACGITMKMLMDYESLRCKVDAGKYKELIKYYEDHRA